MDNNECLLWKMVKTLLKNGPVFMKKGAWYDSDDEAEMRDHLEFREKIKERLK